MLARDDAFLTDSKAVSPSWLCVNATGDHVVIQNGSLATDMDHFGPIGKVEVADAHVVTQLDFFGIEDAQTDFDIAADLPAEGGSVERDLQDIGQWKSQCAKRYSPLSATVHLCRE